MSVSSSMCIRCREIVAPGELGFCTPCAMHTRIEATDGFRELERYLSAWAAFEEWLQQADAGDDG